MGDISYDDKNESNNIIRVRNTVGIVRAISLCSPFYCRTLWFGGTWHSLNWFCFPPTNFPLGLDSSTNIIALCRLCLLTYSAETYVMESGLLNRNVFLNSVVLEGCQGPVVHKGDGDGSIPEGSQTKEEAPGI